MNILVLGVTGMLGSTLFRYCYNNDTFNTFGTLREPAGLRHFNKEMHHNLITNIDVLNDDTLISALVTAKPDVVINCTGLIKQLPHAKNPLFALPINSILPHRLANLCKLSNTRLIHISTDCVFSGKNGMCTEKDETAPKDLYGMSKYIGEVDNQEHVITLRTSIIGHELSTKIALIEWFLARTEPVNGYSNAIFSGFPTIELSRIIVKHIIPNRNLYGLYHVSSDPIDKFSLLKLVADVYGKDIEIKNDTSEKVDRSLDSYRFRSETGYSPPSWRKLIELMYKYK